MPTPSPAIITLLSSFAIAFTAPTFRNALVLVFGTILAPGRRTVAAALRAMGLASDEHFTNALWAYRVLNRARWSAFVVSKILLSLIIRVCLSKTDPLLLVIDETLERRQGPKITYAYARLVSRSYSLNSKQSQLCSGHSLDLCDNDRICAVEPTAMGLTLARGVTIPALSPKTSKKLGKRHRTLVRVRGADFMIQRVRRWQPDHEIILVGDGTYAAIPLVQRCQRMKRPVTLISRLRLDARLFDPPGPQPNSKRGPKPKKGARQTKLCERLEAPDAVWHSISLPWYGEQKEIEYITDTALWHTPGKDPVPVRWVLVRCPDDSFEPKAFFCSDPTVSYLRIILLVLARWNIEVTFQELRTHLGFETQRQWSERAIERTTPCLFGLFSLIVVMAYTLYPKSLPIRTAAWYQKEEATFSDALAVVRRDLLSVSNYTMSSADPDMLLIPRTTGSILMDLASYSA